MEGFMLRTLVRAAVLFEVLSFVSGFSGQPALRFASYVKTPTAGRSAKIACGAVCARRFEFVEYGKQYEGDAEKTICCDGLVKGSKLHLTHWSGNETPQEYKDDLSTEIALRFIKMTKGSSEWDDAVLLNNHFDTDGVMSVWALLNPELALKYEAKIVSAAAAGDFEEWGFSDYGLKLDIALKKLRSEAGSDKKAYEQVFPEVEDLINTVEDRPELWKEDLDKLNEQFMKVCNDEIMTSTLEDNKTKFRHASGKVGTIGIMVHPKGVEEVSPYVVSRTFPQSSAGMGDSVTRILLATEQEDGTYLYNYQRPGHAWADTSRRQKIEKPNVEKLLEVLGPKWTSEDFDVVGTTSPVAEGPEQMADLLLGAERSILPRLA